MTTGLIARLRALRWKLWLIPLFLVATMFIGLAYWFTEPLADSATVAKLKSEVIPKPKAVASPRADETPQWPLTRLTGDEAKVLNLKVLEHAAKRLAAIQDYTATFTKQERINGKLGPRQKIQMKARHKPFSIYFYYVEPQHGREVVYAYGRHDNKLIAHGGGFSRLLIPRLAVPPDHPLALADSRHAITEAGIASLTQRLIGFRKLDLEDRDAETILDRAEDDQHRPRLRSLHLHKIQNPRRPFARVEVLYDPDTLFPVQIKSFDWPKADETGELLLAEAYAYDDLKLDVSLTALDFDPANPAYSFHRY